MKKVIFLLTIIIGMTMMNLNYSHANNFRENPSIEATPNCLPLTDITITLSNKISETPCFTCATWYVSVWAWDGNIPGLFRQIGSNQAYSTSGSWTWNITSWDSGTYPYVFLKWTYSGLGCGYSSMPTQNCTPVLVSPPSYSFTEFYPVCVP